MIVLLVDLVRILAYASLLLWAGGQPHLPPGSVPLVLTGTLLLLIAVLLGSGII